MDRDRWQEITALFEAILARPRGERTTYLENACQGDLELRREVENLLAADHKAGSFLEAPPAVAQAPGQQGPGQSKQLGKYLGNQLGKYEILEKIGQGGFGEVFLGHDPVIRRQVAVKTCTSGDEAFRRRFLREAEIAGRLDHPGIVTIHDSGFAGEILYLVQEYLPGEDLAEVIRTHRPVPTTTRLKQLAQIARGLEYAHGRGVIHRDVKPSNVRVTPHGQVKLLDFGIAKLDNAQTQLTQTGATMGTVAYMAPEQLRGEEVDGRADIFSFGVLAYELLTYRRPFEADSNAAMLYQILEKEPVALGRFWPACPPDLAALVARCLEKKAAARYPDFTALLTDLDPLTDLDLLTDLETIGRPSGSTRLKQTRLKTTQTYRHVTGPRVSGPHIGKWIAAGGLGALMTVGGWLYTRMGPTIAVDPFPQTSMAPGRLAIDAHPWAEVVRIVAKDGTEFPLPENRQTPLSVALPPGEYAVELTHPTLRESRQCQVLVEAASTAHCSQDFASADARDFFARIGD